MHVELNPKLQTSLWEMYFHDPTMQMCRSVYQKHLSAAGIEFFRGVGCHSKKLDPTDPMIEEATAVWLPLALKALDYFFVFGFAPVAVDAAGNRVNIPDVGTYTVSFDLDVFGRTYNVNSTLPVDDSVQWMVYDTTFYHPDASGQFRSIVSTLYSSCVELKHYSSIGLIQETAKFQNPIFIEQKQKVGEQEGREFDFFADASRVTEDAGKFLRSEEALQEMDSQLATLQSLRKASIRRSDKVGSRFVPLKEGQTVKFHPNVEARRDLVQIIRRHDVNVAALFGVPRSMMITDSSVKSDVDGTHSQFRASLMAYKNQLSDFLTEVYALCNPMQGIETVRQKKEAISDATLYSITRQNKLRLVVPVVPSANYDDLEKLWLHGGLPKKEFLRLSAQASGLADSLKRKVDYDLSIDEKKALLGLKPLLDTARERETFGTDAKKAPAPEPPSKRAKMDSRDHT